MKLRSYTYKMTIFLSAHTDRFGCGAARSLFLTVWTPNIGTRMFEHSLDASLSCAPNCRQFLYQFVYVEPSPYHFVYLKPSPQNTRENFAFDGIERFPCFWSTLRPFRHRCHLRNTIGPSQSTWLVTSINRVSSAPLILSLGFKTTQILAIFLISASILPSGMHLISNPLALGHSNTTMSRVSFLSSAGYIDTKRSTRLIAYFDSRI